MYWMRFVCIFYSILIFLLYSLSQAVTPWHFVERAPELSGNPCAEDTIKPWKSTEFLEVANLFRIYPAEAAGENAEFFGCKLEPPKIQLKNRCFPTSFFV